MKLKKYEKMDFNIMVAMHLCWLLKKILVAKVRFYPSNHELVKFLSLWGGPREKI